MRKQADVFGMMQRETSRRLTDDGRRLSDLETKEYAPLSAAGSVFYVGTPTAGQITYWTGAGTIAAAVYGTAEVVRTTTDQSIAGIKTFNGRVAIAGTITSGNTLSVSRNLAAASTDSPVVSIVQDHASDDQPALYVQQDGSGDIVQFYDGANKVMHIINGGFVSIGTVVPTVRLFIEEDTVDTGAFNLAVNSTDASIPRGSNYLNRDLTAASFHGFRMDFTRDDGVTARGMAFAVGKEQLFTSTTSTNDAYIVLMVAQNGILVERFRITSAGLHGINQPSPTARLDVLESTLGSPIFQLITTATNDDVNEWVEQNRAATTNATPTTLHTIAITANRTYIIEVKVLGRRTGGSAGTADDLIVFQESAGYSTKAGVVTLAGAGPLLSALFSDTAATAALVVSGTNILVRVTGVANTNISWHCTCRISYVGS